MLVKAVIETKFNLANYHQQDMLLVFMHAALPSGFNMIRRGKISFGMGLFPQIAYKDTASTFLFKGTSCNYKKGGRMHPFAKIARGNLWKCTTLKLNTYWYIGWTTRNWKVNNDPKLHWRYLSLFWPVGSATKMWSTNLKFIMYVQLSYRCKFYFCCYCSS